MIPKKKHIKNHKKVKLGGIWKGIKITEKDIDDNRKDLLDKLEQRHE